MESWRRLFRGPGGIFGFSFVLVVYFCFFYDCSEVQGEELGEYTVEFKGVPDNVSLELLRAVSDTYIYRDQALPSARLLRNRAAKDIPRLREAMASIGYFKTQIKLEVERKNETYHVIFLIDSGPRFFLEKVRIVDPLGEPSELLPDPEDIGLTPNTPFRADNILNSRDKLLSLLGNSGHPYPEILATDVVADHDTNSVQVSFQVRPGPIAWFGDTEIEGLRRVKEDHAVRMLPWEGGELFRRKLIEQARIELIRSGLFSVVEFSKGEIVSETDRLPMFLHLRERRHRTMRVGLNYTTDFGFGALLGWEHRNMLGRGEGFEILLSGNELRQSLDANFQKPYFYRDDQRLVLRSMLAREDSDAFESRSFRNTARIERDLTENITAGAGIGYDYLYVDEDGINDTFALLSFPLSLGINTTDDLLDPTMGYTLGVLTTPFVETFGDNVTYFRYDFTGSAYYEVLDNRRMILASRGRYGQIVGASRSRVPGSERFYAGGGGSVRGYPYQSLTPLNVDDDPIGGKSVVELSFELRSRLSERFGFAVFLDGGRAYEGTVPNLGDELFWGAGVGLRYYTLIGPIRLDVAFPLRDRESVDDSFQVYISIGQAF